MCKVHCCRPSCCCCCCCCCCSVFFCKVFSDIVSDVFLLCLLPKYRDFVTLITLTALGKRHDHHLVNHPEGSVSSSSVQHSQVIPEYSFRSRDTTSLHLRHHHTLRKWAFSSSSLSTSQHVSMLFVLRRPKSSSSASIPPLQSCQVLRALWITCIVSNVNRGLGEAAVAMTMFTSDRESPSISSSIYLSVFHVC